MNSGILVAVIAIANLLLPFRHYKTLRLYILFKLCNFSFKIIVYLNSLRRMKANETAFKRESFTRLYTFLRAFSDKCVYLFCCDLFENKIPFTLHLTILCFSHGIYSIAAAQFSQQDRKRSRNCYRNYRKKSCISLCIIIWKCI